MGRRKIAIEFLCEDRNRATTFIKRKTGLFKKAHELAILTGAEVAVVVFSQSDKLFTYSNVPCSEVCSRFLQNSESYESQGPNDYTATQNHNDYCDDNTPTEVLGRVVPDSGIDRETNIASTSPVRQTTSRCDSEQSLPRKHHETKSRHTQSELRRNSLSESAKNRARSPVHDSLPERPKSTECKRRILEIPIVRKPLRRATATTEPPLHVREFWPASNTFAPMSPPSAILSAQDNNTHYDLVESQRSPNHPGLKLSSQQQQDLPHSQALPLLPHFLSYGAVIDEKISCRSMTCEVLTPHPLSAFQPADRQRFSLHNVLSASQTLLPARAAHSSLTHLRLSDEDFSGASHIPYRGDDLATQSTSSVLSRTFAQVARPRISTDVDRPFCDSSSSEAAPRHVTNLSSSQYRDNHEKPNHTDELQGSHGGQMSESSISACVLEDFSPTTAQWLCSLSTQASNL